MNKRVILDYAGMFGALALLIVLFSALSNHFLSPSTFFTIANQIPDIMVASAGMTFVLVIAGIDLSVGSVMALCGAFLGVALKQYGVPLPVAVVLCIACGSICGLVNGLVTVAWGLPSFIVTLGMLEVARGCTYLITNSQTQYLEGKLNLLSDYRIAGFSPPFWMALIIVIALQIVLSHTRFGRYAIALGANEESARLSGVNTRSVRVAVFVLSGFLASIASVFHCARLSSADPNAGLNFELEAIAAVVIGGTSLMGGRGSVLCSFLGVLIISVLGYGLAQLGVQEHTKRVVTGCVIVAAVILDYYRGRLSK
jgi:ribose transport system permease protein